MPGWHCRLPGPLISLSKSAISVSVSAIVGDACEVVRLSIVNQKTRQLMMQKTAMRLASRSAVRSFESSALTAGFEDLVEDFDLPAHGVPVDLLDRCGARVTGRSVISFQSIGLRPLSVPRSLA